MGVELIIFLFDKIFTLSSRLLYTNFLGIILLYCI